MLIGVPSPALWAVLGALLRFVPYIGTWIAGLLPLAVAAAVDPGWTMAVATLVLYGVSEVLAGQVVEPFLYGHSTGLSPISVVVAAIFWSWLWGPIGLILSTPADPVPGGAGAARAAAGIPRCDARRPPRADPRGELLPAGAGGRRR